MPKRDSDKLMRLFKVLLDHYGPQHWWPGETDWEVMVGAILTQNTAWTNVEKAIGNLKENRMLTVEGIHKVPTHRLADLIRPSGYFNQKAQRLKDFTAFIVEKHQGNLEHLFSQGALELRDELLSQKGIGPETADAMMLYAGDHLTFVIDAYTLRFAKRYPLPFEPVYETARSYFQQNLPKDLYIYQELHALIDNHAKISCRPKPQCEGCFLRRSCKRKDVKGP
jgi:endonuclease-3 related protein